LQHYTNYVYFTTGPIDANDPFLRVSENVLTVGTRKVQQENARKFLEKVGVRTPGEADELTVIIKQRYSKTLKFPFDEGYLADMRRFIAYAEKNPDDRQRFTEAFIFRIKSDTYGWATAGSVYLDSPFKATGVSCHSSCPLEPIFLRSSRSQTVWINGTINCIWRCVQIMLQCFGLPTTRKMKILDLVANSAGREIELVLGGNPETVQFTEMYLADIKACLAADGL
jgi:hypothetical protein